MRHLGFSLTEAMIALVIISGSMLALLWQQVYINRSFNDMLMQNYALHHLDNVTEAMRNLSVSSPFATHVRRQKLSINVVVDWESPLSLYELKRNLVVY